MGNIIIEVTEEIAAGTERVYGLLADYETEHPQILPPEYFKALTVKEGGYGAGTAFELIMELMGASRVFNFLVSEPQPGRLLVEEDAAEGVVTSFSVEPLGEEQSRVTIRSEFRASGGIRGLFEKWMVPPVLRRVYREELALLQGVFED